MRPHQQFRAGEIIYLHNEEWLARQRVAGKVTADIIAMLGNLVEEGTSKTLLELDQLAREYILDHNCTPTFYQYHGFPSNACWSVNKQLVHGVATEYLLQKGDLVTIDLGATYKGAIADSATTFIVGKEAKNIEHVRLVAATKECLRRGIDVAKAGNHVGEIGYAIYKYAHSQGYEVIVAYGGHGITENKPHALPFVANRALPNDGVRLRAGMTIAIEPLLTTGSTETTVGEDRWTVTTHNLSAHEEHSIFIHSDHTEILTLRDNERLH